MRNKRINLSVFIMASGLIILILVACASSVSEPTVSAATATATFTEKPTISPFPTLPDPASDNNVLYEDDFTDATTKWPTQQYDNYYIGYHQSTYYHIQLSSPHLKTSVYVPGKPTYGDVTIDLKVLTEVATTGDFRYGLTFRRTGDLYYAFVISPVTKKWYVLKSSSDAVVSLAEGTEASIHDIGGEDELRVDLAGSTFSFYINNQLVGETSDPDYINGEVGLFVQTIDSPAVHIHFDGLTILKPNGGLPLAGWLYRDDFTNPASGWPKVIDANYYTGYHEPDYLQVQLLIPRYKRTVNLPGKVSFTDVTIDLKVLTEIEWQPGDFRYGLTFRQTGDLYYAFIISPVTKKWYVLKSSANAITTLMEGNADDIQGRRITNVLRVDAKGDTFTFHINNLIVGEVNDPDYASGEIGVFAQTIESKGTHIHFDELTIWEYQPPSMASSVLLGKENCTNGLDDDGDTFTDFADSDCANIFITTDHHNGANGPVNDTNCSMCHSLPWDPSPTSNQSNQPNQPGSNDHHKGANGPVNDTNCSRCHALPWSSPSQTPNNPGPSPVTFTPTVTFSLTSGSLLITFTPSVTPTLEKPAGHPTSCGPCHNPSTPPTLTPSKTQLPPASNTPIPPSASNTPIPLTPSSTPIPPPPTDTMPPPPSTDTPQPPPSTDTPIPPPTDTPAPPQPTNTP